MRGMVRATLGMIAVSLSAGVAAAAPVAPTYDWSGFYAGIQGGYGWGTFGGTAVITPTVSFTVPPFTIKGGILGGHVGTNWQVGNWVKGIEADFEWTNIHGTNGPAGVASASDTVTINMQGSARAVLGYAWDNWLLYGTGGFAVAGVRHVVAAVPPPGVSPGYSGAFGWTVGGGIAKGFAPGWSGKIDYRYSDMIGSSNIIASGALTAESFPYRVREHAIRFGITRYFGQAVAAP